MAYTYFRAGQIATAGAANAALMVGQTVFRATRDTGFTIQSTSAGNADPAGAIPWETIVLDDLGGWSSGNPTRYTCQVAGWYALGGAVCFDTNNAGHRSAGWFQNGSVIPGGHSGRISAVNSTSTISVVAAKTSVLLAVGQYIELCGGQNGVTSSPWLTTSTGGPRPSIDITFARPA